MVMRLQRAANAASAVIAVFAVAILLGVTVLPSILGYKTYVVLSGSMSPAIPTGSVVMAVPVAPSALRVGDVIVYNRSDVPESVTHRIVRVQGSASRPTFLTKGDANPVPDTWTVQYATGTAGKVMVSVPYLGYVYHAVGTPQGRVVFLAVPVVVVLSLMWLWQMWRPAAKIQRGATEVPEAMAPTPDVTPAKLGATGAEAPGRVEAGKPLSLRQ